jgi:tetratricopeptide (TPR) repeat protein
MTPKKAFKRKKSREETRQIPLQGAWLPWLPGLLGFVLYINTLGHDFALDDAIVITENMFTTEGVSGIPGLLKNDTFYGFFKEEGKSRLVAGGRYRPLTPVMFAIERSLFGDSPFVGHAMNALLYGLLCMFIFYVVRLLLREISEPGSAQWVALLTALLFAAHPIHTEAVANIKGRDEIVTLLACLGAWWAVLRAMDGAGSKWLWVSGPLLFLGLMAKEHAIAFLAVIPVSLWVFRPAVKPMAYLSLWPLLAGALLFLVIRGQVIGWGMGDAPMELMNNPFLKLQGDRYVPFSAGEKAGTILYALWLYVKLLVWPWPLTHDYYPRHIPMVSLADLRALGGLIIYLTMALWAVWGLRSRSVTAFAALYFLATLFLMSNILFPVGTHMSERFLFMPSLGFAFTLAWLVEHVKDASRRSMLRIGLLILMLVWSVLTIQRNPVWKDNFTLFTTDVLVSVNSAKLQNAAGGELIAQAVLPANEARREAMLQRATGHLLRAIEIHPGYKNAALLLGNAYNYLQEYEQSISWYERALQLDPGYTDAKNNLHITYVAAGRYYGETRGDLARALQFLHRAEELRPADFETRRLLGIAYGISGNHAEAIRYFEAALALSPDNADIMVNIGNAWFMSGNPEEGQNWHARAKSVDPEVLRRLGIEQNEEPIQ